MDAGTPVFCLSHQLDGLSLDSSIYFPVLCSIVLSFVAGHFSQLPLHGISQGTSIMVLLIILSLSLSVSQYLAPGYLTDH